jgi:hypothetical protein
MYHVELRQFPHNFCRFNLTERELSETVLDGWARGEWIELGERKWNPHQANLTVLEGPQLPVQQLSMGRGWRNAVRQGSDVTEQLLAGARSALGPPSGVVPPNAVTGAVVPPDQMLPRQSLAEVGGAPGAARDDAALDARLVADSLGLELLASLAGGPVPLATVWRLARKRYPELVVSDCLRLAEGAVHSLIQGGLAVVLVPGEAGMQEPCGSPEQVQRVLLTIESWTAAGSASAWLRKI